MNYLTKLQLFIVILFPVASYAYPLDAYEETGIRRVEAARLAVLGEMRGREQPSGSLLPAKLVGLKLLAYPDLDLPEADVNFTARIIRILGDVGGRYGMSVLDISNPSQPLYAEHRGDYRQNVGSVGKLLVSLALFQVLADIYPNDINARKGILRNSVVTADKFIQTDTHKVRIWDPESKKLAIRRLKLGDKGSLWEWLDWMMSASSNAAATVVMKQVMLLEEYGRSYPVSDENIQTFFRVTPRKELSERLIKTFSEPVSRNGLDSRTFRQGSFFTHYGKKKIPGTSSFGTARQLMLFSLRMEQGRLVDVFSSRELKRLLYMTERRIRYASSPALFESAVYFKSGSLYKCKPEPGFVCKKYHGNVKNYMSSVATVETPVGESRLNYMVTLLSNELYKNSAVQHQNIATYVHRLIETLHPSNGLTADGDALAATFGKHLIGYEEKRQQRMQVVNVQSALEKLGYTVRGVDGKEGPKTSKAIRKFQSDYNLNVDGQVSESLLQFLSIELSARSSPN